MKLSFNLGGKGFTPDELTTTCHITLENGSITESHLTLTAKVPNIDPSVFEELVTDAEVNCPISKLLNTKITVDYTLLGTALVKNHKNSNHIQTMWVAHWPLSIYSSFSI